MQGVVPKADDPQPNEVPEHAGRDDAGEASARELEGGDVASLASDPRPGAGGGEDVPAVRPSPHHLTEFQQHRKMTSKPQVQ